MKHKLALIILLIAQVTLGASAKASTNSDLNKINLARFYYNGKQYEQAIAQYNTVAKSSDFWLLAAEERAHTYGKMGQFDKAIAEFTTIFSPVFVNSASPEVYFTAALVHLRLCQYNKVYEVISNFKNNMRPRIQSLSDIAERKSDRLVGQVVDAVRATGMISDSYMKFADKLPLNFQHNMQMKKLMSLSVIDNKAKNLLARQMSVLAEQDLTDIRANLDKIGLVEAEMMQRLHVLVGRVNKDRPVSGQFKSSSEQLVFPYNGEIWLDELDSYQAKTRACPRVKAGA